MKNPFSLKGETALITGGGSGLGFGIARCFVKAGARVILVGRRLNVLQDAAKQLGPAASCVSHDITAPTDAEKWMKGVARRYGPITILANNAGIHLKKAATETTTSEFNDILQTNVIAAFKLTRAVLPDMMERKHGNILFTASMASLFGIPRVVAYAAAKSAYLGMVRTLATELSASGIRVNAVAPGWIDSAMMRNALANDPERAKRILGRTPMQHFGTADDVGHAATYLCSPAAGFVTGVILPVDGGVSIGF